MQTSTLKPVNPCQKHKTAPVIKPEAWKHQAKLKLSKHPTCIYLKAINKPVFNTSQNIQTLTCQNKDLKLKPRSKQPKPKHSNLNPCQKAQTYEAFQANNLLKPVSTVNLTSKPKPYHCSDKKFKQNCQTLNKSLSHKSFKPDWTRSLTNTSPQPTSSSGKHSSQSQA